MYRRLSADHLFIMGKMWLEKHSFVCDFWVERSRVLLCILVKPEVVIWSLKMFLPTAQPSFITVHGCWRLIPKAWLEDFTDVRSFRFPLCETYSSVSWLKQGLFGLLVALKQITERFVKHATQTHRPTVRGVILFGHFPAACAQPGRIMKIHQNLRYHLPRENLMSAFHRAVVWCLVCSAARG